MKVKEMPLDDRPREKLILRGPQSLNDAELLAILLRTGSRGKSVVDLAYEVLRQFGNLNLLFSQTLESMKKIHGIGKDKAATLIAAFELLRRVDAQKKWESNRKITSPQDIAEIFIPRLRDEMREVFYVVCLNSANKVIKSVKISEGNLNSNVVHPREVFKTAIDNLAANIILIHNHPSGNLEPSSEDIAITKKLVASGKLLNIEIYDHIIIAGNNYLSFVEKRLI